jgi:hypothetical protein
METARENRMKFMILMAADPSWDELSEADQKRIISEHGRFEADLRAQGSYLSTGRFGPEPGMAVLQSPAGRTSIVSAPEPGRGAIGGFYLIDVKDMNQALEWASRCRFISGTNWVYPLWEE